jgi:hypothetical protein
MRDDAMFIHESCPSLFPVCISERGSCHNRDECHSPGIQTTKDWRTEGTGAIVAKNAALLSECNILRDAAIHALAVCDVKVVEV